MKGRILGFDASSGSGAIASEGGERFTFVAAQWRGQQAIQGGLAVDFEPMSGVATEIYPVGDALGGSVDLSHLAASPAAQKLRTLATTTLAFPLAVLLLLATLLPAISSPQQSVSLWSLGTLQKQISANPLFANDDVSGAQEALKALDARETDLKTHTTGFGGMPIDNGPELRMIAEQRAQAEAQLGSARTAKTVTTLLAVRWLVPLLACGLIWFCWASKPARTMTLATGGVSVLTAIVIYAYRQSIVGLGGASENSIGAMLSANLEAAISVGMGTWLIGLIGAGLLLAGFGVVRNPLAGRA